MWYWIMDCHYPNSFYDCRQTMQENITKKEKLKQTLNPPGLWNVVGIESQNLVSKKRPTSSSVLLKAAY